MSRSCIVPALLLAALGTAGCYVTTRQPPGATAAVSAPAPPAPPSGSINIAAPQVAAGVTAVDMPCDPNAAETCNGVDDNCDGQIDEGCGYSSGDIQVTLSWGSGADLDLYVTDPFGETIYYNHNQSQSGGMLDHDARGNCRPDQANNMIENVYWAAGRPPSGTYTIEVHFWKGSDGCSARAGITDALVSLAVGGQVIGSYQVQGLAANQRVDVATFTVP